MSHPRILVVDDEPAILHAVERVLSNRYEVHTARDMTSALALVQAQGFDLAILDVRMPEDDGFQTCGKLREVQPDLDVIFMTGAIHEIDVQLVRSIRERAFYFIQKPFERDVLLTIVDRCLELRRLAAENKRYVALLEEELEQGRAFQQSMLPSPEARFGDLAFHARYVPCEALGGDLYDYVSSADYATFLVADVSGHGVSAAMLTAVVKSALHAASDSDFCPVDVVERVGEGLCSFDVGRFVTLFVGRVHTLTNQLEYVSAGHPPALLWGPDRDAEQLGKSGPMVSPAFPGLARHAHRIQLAPGDRLLLYTDGIVEAAGDEGLFGMERLVDIATREPPGDTSTLDALLHAVEEFGGGRPPADDTTLLLANVGQ